MISRLSRLAPGLAPGLARGLAPGLAWRPAGPMRGLLPLLFALLVAPVLVVLALAVPTGEVPDEVAHILRADSVRHGFVAGFRQSRLDHEGNRIPDAALRADAGLLAPGFAFQPGIPPAEKHVTRQRQDALDRMLWENRLTTLSVPNTAVYPPPLYLPGAAGLHAAKLTGAGPHDSILFARLVNAALYLGCGALALRVARRGRAALFAVLCLPMAMALAASMNQDGPAIACAALAAALLTRGTWRGWWLGTLLFGVAAMAKPYLLPLALVIPAAVPALPAGFGTRRRTALAAGGLALATLPALAWMAAMAVFVASPFVRGPGQAAGPLYAGPAGTMFGATNPAEQARILLADPTRLVSMPLDAIWEKGEWLWREGVGVLGTLDVILPDWSYDAWIWVAGAVVLAGFVVPWRGLRVAGLPGLLVPLAALLGLLLSCWAAYVLQYMSWTRVGEAMIDGVQGRYFIPVAAFALPLLALPRAGRPGVAGVLRAVLLLPAVAMAAVQLVLLPLTTLGAYYIR